MPGSGELSPLPGTGMHSRDIREMFAWNAGSEGDLRVRRGTAGLKVLVSGQTVYPRGHWVRHNLIDIGANQ